MLYISWIFTVNWVFLNETRVEKEVNMTIKMKLQCRQRNFQVVSIDWPYLHGLRYPIKSVAWHPIFRLSQAMFCPSRAGIVARGPSKITLGRVVRLYCYVHNVFMAGH